MTVNVCVNVCLCWYVSMLIYAGVPTFEEKRSRFIKNLRGCASVGTVGPAFLSFFLSKFPAFF